VALKRSGAVLAAQAGAGSLLLIAPATAARLAAGGGRPAPAWLVRLLGARMVAQAGVSAALLRRGADRRRVLRAGAAVDALHALSMVGAAAAWPRYRAGALASAGAAAASAAGAAGAAR
jgi:hypothetical protein